MAKIGILDITTTAAGIKQSFRVDIKYSKAEFYCLLPAVFNESFDMIPRDQLSKYHARTEYKSKHACYTGAPLDRFVYAPSEAKLKENLLQICNYLQEQAIKERKVIFVDFSDSGVGHGGRHYNNEHPSIAMQLGLTYGRESRIGDNPPKYYTNTGREYQIYSRDGVIIIDDTPEARERLELLYGKLDVLIKALTDATESADTLLDMITSKTPLLSLPSNIKQDGK